MKKTIQIVTVPLGKEGWSKGDIINDGYVTSLSIFDVKDSKSWQAQQLLVLSDDEIQEGNCVYELVNYRVETVTSVNKEYEVCKFDGGAFDLTYTKKVIASYPHIEGTLPLSKETVQAWINAGTPDEGNIEMKHKSTGRDTIGTTPAGEPIKINSFIEVPKLDSQGNLVLEFGKKTINKTRNVGTSFDSLIKPQPDFQAIFSKAKEIADDICKRSFLPTEGDFYEGLVVGIDTGLHICADKNKLT